jgi:3-methyladenine DNA glycosylase AlkC
VEAEEGCLEAATGRPVRGARSKRDVDHGYLQLLNAGVVQSRTHVEQMAMSSGVLLRRAFPDLEFDPVAYDAVPFIARLRLTGALLRARFGDELDRSDMCWISDTVRGWIAMSIASDRRRTLTAVITGLLPYARDEHFAVREWAWLAARPLVCEEPRKAIQILESVVRSDDPRERRFAIEVTRPRSVWGSHIPELKATPEQAANLLAVVRCDPSAYVRTAAGNWFNDVAKSRPDWVTAVTGAWLDDCRCPATRAIVRRGRRSLRPGL